MSLLSFESSMAVVRALLAAAGIAAATVAGDWAASAACFAALSATTLLTAREAQRRERHWRRVAESDPLTGLGNYRQLHEGLAERVAADPSRLAVLTLDVDRFKEINERFGHLEGDRLLQEVGQVLSESVRGGDVVARQGGDEFAVLASGTDGEGARILAERIEHALARVHAADQTPVSASVGIAVYPSDGRTAIDLLERADAELRRTKQERRTQPAAEPAAA